MTTRRLRKRLAQVPEASQPADGLGRAVDIFLVALIGLNVLAIVMGSDRRFQSAFWRRAVRIRGLFRGGVYRGVPAAAVVVCG